MAVSNVQLKVDATQAVQALRQVNRASGQADTTTQQLTRSVTRSGGAMDGMSRQARSASKSVATLGNALRNLAAAASVVQAARFVFAKTAELETQTRSIQTLTGSVEQAKQIIQELQQLGAATPFTSAELIEAAKRLSAFGVAGNEVVEVTRRLGDVAGATSANLNELALVYGQVQAKGRLQGEELLQFQERGVALQAELQRMYGLTGEEFSKALSKGQISAQAVEVAIKRLTETGGRYANGATAQSDTLAGKLSTLQDSFDGLARELGRAFAPTVSQVISGITEAVNGFAAAIKGIPQPVVSATVELVKIVAQMILLQKAMQGIIALRAAFVGALTVSAGAVAATGAAATGSASAFALYTNNTKALAASAAAATPKLAALRGMLLGIAKIGIITVGINLVVTGLANTIKANQEIAKLRGQRAAGGAAAMYGGAAPKEAKAAAQQTLRAIQAERKRGVSAATRILGPVAGLVGAQTPADVIDRARVLRERELAARATLALPTRQEAAGGGGGGGTYDLDADKKRDAAAKKAARDAERAAKAAAKELARVNGIVRERNADIQLARIKFNLEDKIAAAQAQGDALTERRLQGQQRLVDIQAEYARLLADPANRDQQIQELINTQGIEALKREQLRTERDLNAIDQQRMKDGAQLLLGKQQELELLQQTDPLKRDLLQIEQYLNSEEIKKLKLTDEQLGKLRDILTVTAQIKNKSDEMKQLYKDIGMNIKSGVVDAIQSAVDGTKTLGQVASDVLRNIANKLLDVAVNMALFGAMSGTGTGGGLLGRFFKPRAMGGSVTGGKPYLVGEKGPELFMPGRSGGIAPTGSFGGGVNVVVNVDASGTSVQGNEPDAAQLGRAVSVAVQAEIIKQQRPGGLLAATRR